MSIFENKINGEIPISGVIDNKKNPHDLFYYFSKYGPYFLF